MQSGTKPYELHNDPDQLNPDLSPALVTAAGELLVYDSSMITVVGPPFESRREAVPAVRCYADDVIVHPNTLAGRVAHLTMHHGWRMNGLQYDNQNRVIGGEVPAGGDAETGLVED